MAWRLRGRPDERGATLVIVAMMVFLFLGIGALAVDLGMAASAATQAQRAADAGALAGASAFIDFEKDDPVAETTAEERALDYATRHDLRDQPIVDDEVTVEVIPAEEKVRVTIQRDALNTWFASTFGMSTITIAKKAAAIAAEGGRTPCIKPFAVPDLWDENSPPSGNGANRITGDTDNDNIWDADERWSFTPPSEGTDYYAPWNEPTEGQEVQTGYGSTFRNAERDFGLQLKIKAQAPGGRLGPGFFYLLRLQDSQGGNDIRTNILECSPGTFSTDSTYRIEGGDKVGPTEQAIEDLIALDAGASWSDGTVVGSRLGTLWRNSERVVKVGIFDPNQIAAANSCNGNCELQFRNIAELFLEGFEGNGQNEYLVARFLRFVPGSGEPGEGTAGGSLVKRIVLVE